MNPIRKIFEQFVDSNELPDTLKYFEELKNTTGATNAAELQCAVAAKVSYRHKRLFEMLRERASRAKSIQENDDKENNDDEDDENQTRKPKRIVVVGAGPVGLRAAVEALLLGWHVTVLEKRTEYSRLNVIKTWSQSVDDLLGFGLKIFAPNISKHGQAKCVSIKTMQETLTKVALLLGVDFRYGESVIGVIDDGDDDWNVVLAEKEETNAENGKKDALSFTYGQGSNVQELEKLSLVDFYQHSDESAILSHADARLPRVPFDHLLLAEGERARLTQRLGFDRRVTRYASAIGLVLNIKQAQMSSNHEKFVVSMADGGGGAALGQLAQRGIVCENVELLPATDSLFVVATVRKESLLARGVLRADQGRAIVSRDNVDLEKLDALALDIASVLLPSSAGAIEFAEHHPKQLFDFSSKAKCDAAARTLGSSAQRLVMPIGDALASPFWPQGLGVNRGFHSALDAVDCIRRGQGVDFANFAYRASHYHPFLVKVLTKASTWTADITSRYARELFKQMHFDSLNRGDPVSPLPEIMLSHFGWKNFEYSR